MTHLIQFLFSLIASSARTRLSLQLEVATLRHQLSLYRTKRRKPRVSSADRLLWSFVSKWWSGWREALYFVQPRTVVAWQKRRFRDYWRALSQHGRPGRPKIAPELRQLIKRMWQANPTWGSPRIVHFNVTEYPTAQWTAQQLTEAFPFDTAPRYLLRDGDGSYGRQVQRRIRSFGTKEVITAPASPWQNPYVERVIGSIRRELLDHVIVLNERHLKRLLSSYLDYYHPWRTHRSLAGDAPDHRPVRSAKPAHVIDFPAVHGLHHCYLPRVA